MASRPPLNAVFVFCEAARCGSFKLAAEQLCVTPGAVSRQIKALEDHLGQALFERSASGVSLTRNGQRLHRRLGEHISGIQAELAQPRGGSGRKTSILVDTSVTLGMHWLIPRLPAFKLAHPEIQVQLKTVDGPVELSSSADVFIRRDPAELRGLASTRFLDEWSVLAASPQLQQLTRRAPPDRIGSRSRPDLWPQWCAHHGLDDAAHRPNLEFDNTVLAIQATCQGLGVMVVPALFVGSMIASGMLVALSETRVRTGSYHLATRARRGARGVGAFAEWLNQAHTS